MRADVHEAELAVERDRPRVVLPHAQPDRRGPHRGGFVDRRLHQPLGDAPAVPGLVHVESPHLDRSGRSHAGRRWTAPQLGEGGESVANGEERGDLRRRNLRELKGRAVRTGQMSGHILRARVRLEGDAEGAGGQIRERLSVFRDRSADRAGRLPHHATSAPTAHSRATRAPPLPHPCRFTIASTHTGTIGRSAALGHRPVAVQADLLADGHGSLAVLGVVDADRGERVVHGPLHFRHRLRHLLLDAIEQRGQVEAVAALVHAAGGEVPARRAAQRSFAFIHFSRSDSFSGCSATT